MQMNYEKDGKYEKLYPKTISTNVEMLDGRDLNKWKQDFEDEFNIIESDIKELKKDTNGELWRGSEILSATASITPSKALSDTRNGYILVFARKSGSAYDNYNYYHLPKVHLLSTNNGMSSGVKILLGSVSGSIVSKYIYFRRDSIAGNALNEQSGSEDVFLLRVYEY